MDKHTLPEWVVIGTKFRCLDRTYHVRGIVDGNAVLREWWRRSQRWTYIVEDPIWFWVNRDNIKIITKKRSTDEQERTGGKSDLRI